MKRRDSQTKILGPSTCQRRSRWLSAIRIINRRPVHRGLDGQRPYSYCNPDDCDQRGQNRVPFGDPYRHDHRQRAIPQPEHAKPRRELSRLPEKEFCAHGAPKSKTAAMID